MKQRLFLGLKIAGGVILISILSFFLFRKSIYEYCFSYLQKKVKSKYQCDIISKEISPSGITGFELTNLVVLPEGRDTLLSVTKVDGSVSLLGLLSGNIRFTKINLSVGKLTANGHADKNNFSFLFRKRSTNEVKKSEKNYAALLNRLIKAAFNSVPNHIEVSDFLVSYQDEIGAAKFRIPTFFYDHDEVKGQVLLEEKADTAKWIIDGKVEKSKEHFDGKFYGEKGPIVIPYIFQRLNLHCRFDTLSFALREKDFEDDSLRLLGDFSIYNLAVKHPRIDSNTVKIAHLASNYIFDFGKASLAFQSPSVLLNKMDFSVKTHIDKSDKGFYALEVNMKKISAQDFFTSLPEGLFNTFDGIQCEGALSYDLKFAVDVSRPDSVLFESKFTDEGFKIKKYGVTNFSKMNGPFVYTAYEYGKPAKSFVVGEENPMFTPIDKISPYLKAAVLQSEDGSFYMHRGFREDAFKMAVSENIKQGRFARGGSTISMQLVKNVFLSRKKTIARKVEEALIVWLIENKRITSKERMYEVYLNVIEWGPYIYGIKAASQFYFDKEPSELTIEESIYLASIIPRPKAFRYSFDEDGNLRTYLEPYFKRVAELLMRREVITEEQKTAVVANVKLKGPAKDIVIKDTTTLVDDEEEDSEIRFPLFRRKEDQDEKEDQKQIKKEAVVNEDKKDSDSDKKKKWNLFKK